MRRARRASLLRCSIGARSERPNCPHSGHDHELAVEAAFRGVPICDLIGDLIMGMLQAPARKEAAPVPSWVAEAEPAEAG